MPANLAFMQMAISLATENVRSGAGGPFGAVVVKDGKLIAACANSVTATNDPTAHAEVNVIRAACKTLGSFQLAGCEIYTSCEPCPMCMAAMYWARPAAVYYANTKQDAAEAGFDDSFIYTELALEPERRTMQVVHVPVDGAIVNFDTWRQSQARVDY